MECGYIALVQQLFVCTGKITLFFADTRTHGFSKVNWAEIGLKIPLLGLTHSTSDNAHDALAPPPPP